MPILIGSVTPTAIWIGSTPVQKIYIGATEVWPLTAGGLTLAAAAGAFALTGQDALLRQDMVLVTAAGSYVLTGNDASLTVQANSTMAAAPGTYTLTGVDANLLRALILSAVPGAYSISGQDIGTVIGLRLQADAGAFALNGFAAGLLRSLRLQADTGSYSLTGNAAILGDPYWSNVVFLSGFNGADGGTVSNEESAAARALTFVGNAQLDTAFKKFGSASLLCDGIGDYVTTPGSTDWDLGSGPFTIEFWLKLNAKKDQGFVGRGSAGSGRWVVYGASNGRVYLYHQFTARVSGTTDITTLGSDFVHVAVCREANNTRLFLNGVMDGKGTTAYTFGTSADSLMVGTDPEVPASRSMNGWLDEVRITKGVALYPSDSSFTPPTAPFPRG